MRKLKSLIIIFLALCLLLLPLPVYAQSTVVPDVGGATGFLEYPPQRMSFYASGRYWAFYVNDTSNEFCYRSSTDASAWSGETTVRTNVSLASQHWSITFDGTYVHYAIRPNAPTGIMYRRGIPTADGSITWSAAEQTARAAASGNRPDIAVDTSGYAYIAYNIGGDCEVTKNTNNDGTWSTEDGWPQTVKAGSMGGASQTIIALTNGRMLCVYTATTEVPPDIIRMQRWDGVAWGAERITLSDIENYAAFAVVAEDDDAHIVFLKDASYDIVYVKYTYSTNSVSGETTVYSGATSTSYPAITRITDTYDLFVFWENAPTNDHIYYRKYSHYTDTWESNVDLVDESVIDGLPASGYHLNTDYTSNLDKVGVYYIADPQKLKYKNVAETASVTTLSPSAVTATTATLRGNISSVGTGSITTRGFQYNYTPSESGAGYTQESGSFSVGVYSLPVTDLETDTIYYNRAYAINAAGTETGEWVGFMTTQPSYESEEEGEGENGYAPSLPSEPGGWIRPPKDWGTIGIGEGQIPLTFFVFLLLVGLVVFVGLLITKYTRSLGILFMTLGFIIVVFCFWPKGGYLDWWVLFPYILVGWALLVREQPFAWN